MTWEFVSSHTEWFWETAWPPMAELWERLDVPEFLIYKEALQACAHDTWKASQSSYQLLFLTFRPVVILLWIILKFLWRNLLEHGSHSLYKGAQQVKAGSIAFYNFQRSLSRTELLGEAGVIATCVALYYFRKWLKRQTYWARAVQWYRGKKAKCVQACSNIVHKVAEVSKLLAMAVPHLVFVGLCLVIRIFCPSFVRWVAHDTYLTAILSVGYPLVSTLMCIHARRHPHLDTPSSTMESQDGNEKMDKSIAESQRDNDLNVKPRPGSSRRRKPTVKSSSQSTTSLNTNSNVPPEYSRFNLALARNTSSLFVPDQIPDKSSPKTAVVYWLRYWQCYAIVQALGLFCSIIPIFGRIVTRYTLFSLLAGELKLFFFIWLFGMDCMLASIVKDQFMAPALPFNIIKRFATPSVLWLHQKISELVSEEFWERRVVSNTKNVLSGLVFIKMLSEQTKDWVVHVVEESRVVVVPAVTLFMPGFVTAFGVAYVQYIVPTAKSAQARGAGAQLVYLQYWVLNCAVTGLLTWFAGILWWIPLSTHAIFVLWSYLVFPQTIRNYYDILESELIAFGILPSNGDVVQVNNTRTARLVQTLVSRLPSAKSIENDTKSDELQSKESEDSVPELSSKTSDSEMEEISPLKHRPANHQSSLRSSDRANDGRST